MRDRGFPATVSGGGSRLVAGSAGWSACVGSVEEHGRRGFVCGEKQSEACVGGRRE